MAMKKYALQTVSVCEGSEEILSEKLFDTREEAEAFRNVLEQVTTSVRKRNRILLCTEYRIVEHETGRVIRDGVTIYQIQKAFAYAEIPLEDKQTEKYQREKLLIAAGEKEKWKQHPANEKVWNPAAKEFYMKYIEEDPTDGEPGTEENEPE